MIAAFSSIIDGWRQSAGKLHSDSVLFFSLLLLTGLITPTIVAVILGQSAFSEDLTARLDGFWRTRPISPPALFGVKLLTALNGIVLLLVMLVIVGAFGVMAIDPTNPMGLEQSYMAAQSGFQHLILGQVVWLPFVLVLSMVTTVVCRLTILSVLLSVMVVLAMVFAPVYPKSQPIIFKLMAGPIDGDFVSLAIALVLATLIMAWCGQRIFCKNLAGRTPSWRLWLPTCGIAATSMGDIR